MQLQLVLRALQDSIPVKDVFGGSGAAVEDMIVFNVFQMVDIEAPLLSPSSLLASMFRTKITFTRTGQSRLTIDAPRL